MKEAGRSRWEAAGLRSRGAQDEDTCDPPAKSHRCIWRPTWASVAYTIQMVSEPLYSLKSASWDHCGVEHRRQGQGRGQGTPTAQDQLTGQLEVGSEVFWGTSFNTGSLTYLM